MKKRLDLYDLIRFDACNKVISKQLRRKRNAKFIKNSPLSIASYIRACDGSKKESH